MFKLIHVFHHMQQIKKVLRIPKDPRTSNIVFFTEIPHDLLNKIDPDEWKGYIDGLNNIFAVREKASIWNALKTVLILPSILSLNVYEKPVGKYLKRINEKLKNKGVYIEDPSANGYTELEIVISQLEES